VVRYLLDEHIPRWLRRVLVQRAPDLEVWCVGDPQAPSLGDSDPQILAWCQSHEFILVTNNRASMPRHLAEHLAAGGHVPGILVVDPTATFDELVTDLVLIAGASLPGEFNDQIRYLPVG
jgi:hypothetical protein